MLYLFQKETKNGLMKRIYEESMRGDENLIDLEFFGILFK